jgi:hypothetical protein
MIWATLSVDECRASPFRFVKQPKLGDRVGYCRSGGPAQATIVALRHEHGPNGLGRLLVDARTAA